MQKAKKEIETESGWIEGGVEPKGMDLMGKRERIRR
jgi:hypothetical protein